MWWMFWDEKLHNKATIKGKRIDFMSRFAWFRNCLLFVFIYLRAGWRTWRDIIPSYFESQIMQTKESEGWFILLFCSKGILDLMLGTYYLMLGTWRDVVPSQIMPRKASDTSSETKNRKSRETSTEGEMQCLFPYFIGPYISTDIRSLGWLGRGAWARHGSAQSGPVSRKIIRYDGRGTSVQFAALARLLGRSRRRSPARLNHT